MNKLDILSEQCDICSNSSSANDCNNCEKKNEIHYLVSQQEKIFRITNPYTPAIPSEKITIEIVGV